MSETKNKKFRIAIYNNIASPAEVSLDVQWGKLKTTKNYLVEIKAFKTHQEIINFNPDFIFTYHPVFKIGGITTYSTFLTPFKYVIESRGLKDRRYLSVDGCLTNSEFMIRSINNMYDYYGERANILDTFSCNVRGKTDFKNYLNPQKLRLAYFGNNWEKSCYNEPIRFEQLFKDLTNIKKVNFLNLYGNPDGWFWIDNKEYLKGRVDYSSEENVFDIYRNAGVGLALSAHSFYDEGLANNRIFEIIASGTVCIADDLPFYKKSFGDSLLYITTRDEEEMANQIISHFNWIKSNPDEAISKAKRAHEILCNEFSAEVMMEKLIDFHLLTKNKRRNNSIKIKDIFKSQMVKSN